MPAELSVVIVTFNSRDCIAECLRSILTGPQESASTEIIVVDNASSDGTPELLAREFSKIVLIRNTENAGFAAGVNQGAARATGLFLLILNPDTVLSEGAVPGLVNYMKEHPGTSAAGCGLMDRKGRHQPSCWRKPTLFTALAEAFLPHAWSLPLVTESPTSPREVDMVSGACMLVRPEVFSRMSGFDPRFFMYYEDADFCLRVRRAGGSIVYLPEVRVTHLVRKSTGSDPDMFFLHVYRSKMIFFRKHFKPFVAPLASAVIMAGVVLRIPVYALAGALLMNRELLRLAKYHTLVIRKMMK